MSEVTLNAEQLKTLLKVAIVEILQEQKEVFTDLIIEAMEDIALAKAIEEGESTEIVSREAIFNIFNQQP
jgi:DNA-binding protein YbaB